VVGERLEQPLRMEVTMKTSKDETGGPSPAHLAEQGWGRVLRVAVARALLTTAALLVVWSLVPTLAGWTPRVIMSGSMEPRIVPGDIVVTRAVPAAILAEGQVVTVQDPDHAGRTRTHRLVRRDPEGGLVLRGDANQQADSSHVAPSQVLGLGVLRVPYVGRPLFWVAERNWAGLLALVAVGTWCVLTVLPPRSRSGNRTTGDTGRPSVPRRGHRRRTRVAIAITTGVVGATAMAGPADAAFLWRAANASSALNAAGNFYPYRTAVLADSPTLFWRLAEPTGTTSADSSGNNRPGTYINTSMRAQTGPLVAERRDTAITSTSNAFVTASASVAAPAAFSVEAWVKTTTAGGGRLLGLGNGAASTLSTTTDRQVYLAPNGRVFFGVGSAKTTINSTSAINNGTWHHVVGTYTSGAGGMKLYVDGVLAATGTGTGTNLASGYWRAGADNLSGWPSAPSGSYLVGSIDEVAVYPSALTATKVLAHYTAGITP
jgi:signal peptidase I